ncbi:MAG: glycosyltransferase family 4 protein [Methanobacteriota archaeon]
MDRVHIGLSTQTPLVRFLPGAAVPADDRPPPGLADAFQEGSDYVFTPGGVCRLLLPTVREWTKAGWLAKAYWFSLQPEGPRAVRYDDLPLEIRHLALPPQGLAAYARTKEKLWRDIHGLGGLPFDRDDFRFYSRYNWFTSDALLAQDDGLDLAYVHDFQLLQVGGLLGLAAPTVLRWHVPFVPARIPAYTRNFLVRAMEDFDSVIVSTRRELAGLTDAGFRGQVDQVYPHVDVSAWPRPRRSDVAALSDAWELGPDAKLVLCVARMDPMKRQDLAIRAFARVAGRHPDARLVFIGNGSFSGSKKGGLGMDKSRAWRDRLLRLGEELGVRDRVRFAGFVPDREVGAAYARATAVVLPPDIEGFGLTAFEAWSHGVPCAVSTGAGVAEVVRDGEDGFVFPPGDDAALAEALDALLSDPETARSMGARGAERLSAFDVSTSAAREREILQQAIDRFRGD